MLYGASGHATAYAHILEQTPVPGSVLQAVAFIDDEIGGTGRTLMGKPVISFAQWQADYRPLPVMISLGSPAAKKQLAQKIRDAGGTFRNLLAGSSFTQAGIETGVGAAVAQQVYIGPNTRIGDHVLVMPMCSIGHDVVIGDYSTVCPGCTISGHVVIEEEVFIGAGATVVNGRAEAPLVIGRGSSVSAGSTVTRSLPAASRVAGNPARPLRQIAAERRMSRPAVNKEDSAGPPGAVD